MQKGADSSCAERAAEHRERLMTLGTLAAETAHEFNNVLTFVSHNVEVVLARVSDEQKPELVDELLEIREGVDQLATLSRALRDFGSPHARPSLVDASVVLDTVARILRARLQCWARLQRHYEPALPVRAIEPQLRHALLNLVVNAIEAFDAEEPSRNWIRLHIASDAAQRTVITIQNNGRPIPPADLDRIFERFYTTKESGTGMGLALCQRVIHGLGGTLVATSDPATTSFVVTLPGAVQ
jgi:two-component system, NtrC family, sensor kinase